MKTKKQRRKRQVRCKSGIMGWQDYLRRVYASVEAWISSSEIYGLHTRLGFHSAEEAWEANPLIQGSVIHTDYCTVE